MDGERHCESCVWPKNTIQQRVAVKIILLQEYDGSLDSVSVAGTASFNRRGSLLAVGCNDGRIVVWDFLTRGIAKIISAHVHPVTSVR